MSAGTHIITSYNIPPYIAALYNAPFILPTPYNISICKKNSTPLAPKPTPPRRKSYQNSTPLGPKTNAAAEFLSLPLFLPMRAIPKLTSCPNYLSCSRVSLHNLAEITKFYIDIQGVGEYNASTNGDPWKFFHIFAINFIPRSTLATKNRCDLSF
jgi:hypothetical protein